ncbi:MAG: NADP-dependent oxidoreductase [Acidobacteria bacterium 21-70-11]|nr:MAG: NADP-dependent oxidoreductase [Acidobacteria bacterium 21-70-11]
MATVNKQITLAARPVGLPRVSDFHLVYSPVPSPSEGEVLVRSVYLSLDPYMRGRMSDAESYARPVAIGEVMTGGAVASVVESRHADFLAGDTVEGMLGWQEYAIAQGRELRKIDPGLAPISTALGVLGMPGLTAYFGLLDICDPQPGETAVVSGAAGAVGMIAGQIAKIKGCRVVGVAGSDAKISWLLDELGFDAAFNYKTIEYPYSTLKELCPAGIDVYFDNVGGAISDAVMRLINAKARISVCGQISQYNLKEPELGPRWLGQLIVKQAKVQGFLVSGYAERFPTGLKQLATWLKQGKLKYREEVAQGIEAAPQAFIGMLQGKNQGKQLVQLS